MLACLAAMLALWAGPASRLEEVREATARLVELSSLPSASDDAEGTAAAALWISDRFGALGFETRLLPGEGNPLVLARRAVVSPALTVMFYAHYDTQPAGPTEGWGATGGDAFAPRLLSDRWDEPAARRLDPAAIDETTLRSARLYARGAADDKAPIVMHLAALERWLGTPASARIELKYLFEGEEEAGSPHTIAALQRHREMLRADLLVLCDGPMDALGRRSVYLGARGVMTMRLRVRTAPRGGHSGNYGLLPNAAWRLASLLATMKDAEGRVSVEGFHDDVASPTPSEREALKEASLAEPAIAAQFGGTSFEGDPRAPYYERLLFTPGLNLTQLISGGPGNQIPATAEALLEARLVARQDPRKVYEALRRHVAARMPDAELDFLEGVPAARMDAADPVIARAIAAASKAAGSPVLVYPSLGGTLPLLHAAAGAGHRFVGLPLVNFDNNQHVGNENLRLAVLPEGIEFLTRFLDALAAP